MEHEIFAERQENISICQVQERNNGSFGEEELLNRAALFEAVNTAAGSTDEERRALVDCDSWCGRTLLVRSHPQGKRIQRVFLIIGWRGDASFADRQAPEGRRK